MITLLALALALGGMTKDPAEAQLDEQLFGEPCPAVARVEGLPTFYQVNQGDTLCGIARRYGISLELIAQASGLSRYDLIYEGQYLIVPTGGLIHHVVAGDTLWDISVRYGVALEEILGANGLDAAGTLPVGADVLVPVTLPGQAVVNQRGERHPFIWPVRGMVSSPFGIRDGRLHEGLDIAADSGTPIVAAADGSVVYAGPAGTYGLLVILMHGSGWSTYYAHCDRINVTVGQNVTAGEVIAAVGSTGHSTGPHLHFEVRQNGYPSDPEAFMAEL